MSPVVVPRDGLLVVLILWLLVFCAFSQMVVIGPLVPRLATLLQTRPEAIGRIVTAHGVVLAVATLTAGPFSDRLGRRRILVGSGLLLALSLLAHHLVTSLTQLMLLRAVSGAAAGITLAGAIAYVGDVFPSERRGRANGRVMTGFAAGQVLAGPMAALLGERIGPLAPFEILGGIALVGWILTWRFLPPSGLARADRVRLLPALGDYARLLSARRSLAACGVLFLMLFGVSCFATFFPAFLEREIGFGADRVALLLASGGAANALVGPVSGAVSDRLGRPLLVAGGSLLAGAMMLAIPLAASSEGLWLWLAFPLLMAGISIRGGAMQTYTTELVPDLLRGRFVSLTISCGHLGFAIGAAAAAWVLGEGRGFAGAAALAALSGPAIAVLMLTVLAAGRRRPADGQD